MAVVDVLPEPLRRIALGISYEGSSYRGWQTQPGGNTVQDVFQQALKTFLDHTAVAVCAGRTDTGVHALQQVVHVDTSVERRPQSWVRGLNSWLPDTIQVQWAQVVEQGFHARFSAQARTYIYLLRNHQVASPFVMNQAGWVYQPLDLSAMQQAAHYLLGEHDFSCFRSSQCQAARPIRTLMQLDIIQREPFFLFIFRANAFLHHMVRNIMGALITIGQGKQPVDWVLHLLEQRDRRLSAPTFSPKGLYLADVAYSEEYALPLSPWSERLFSLTGISIGESVHKGMS